MATRKQNNPDNQTTPAVRDGARFEEMRKQRQDRNKLEAEAKDLETILTGKRVAASRNATLLPLREAVEQASDAFHLAKDALEQAQQALQAAITAELDTDPEVAPLREELAVIYAQTKPQQQQRPNADNRMRPLLNG